MDLATSAFVHLLYRVYICIMKYVYTYVCVCIYIYVCAYVYPIFSEKPLKEIKLVLPLSYVLSMLKNQQKFPLHSD